MGGFRSKPDVAKNTITKESLGLTYAICTMCGTTSFTQDGDCTWKTHTSPPSSPIAKPTSSEFSTVTEVTTTRGRG